MDPRGVETEVDDDPYLDELDKRLIAAGMSAAKDGLWPLHQDRLRRLADLGYVAAQQLSAGGVYYSGLTVPMGTTMGRKLLEEGF